MVYHKKRTRFILVGLSESFFGASAKCKKQNYFSLNYKMPVLISLKQKG